MKPATLRSPALFTVVIEAKSTFQEAWSCMVLFLRKATADGLGFDNEGCGKNDKSILSKRIQTIR